MNDIPARPGLRSALREWRRLACDRRLWGVFAMVALLFGLGGPFGTADSLGLGARLAYWTAAQAGCWAFALLCVGAAQALVPRDRPWAARLIPAALLAALPMAAWVTALDAAVFGTPLDLAEMADGLPRLAGLSVAIAVLAHLGAGPRPAETGGEAAPAPAPEEPPTESRTETRTETPAEAAPAILARLPAEKRGPLLRLSMQDHYVEVVTERGSELILLRLSDAMRETAPEPGRQVHRSHWVAARALAGARRAGGRPRLILRDGAEIPVSRSHAPALREAGWL